MHNTVVIVSEDGLRCPLLVWDTATMSHLKAQVHNSRLCKGKGLVVRHFVVNGRPLRHSNDTMVPNARLFVMGVVLRPAVHVSTAPPPSRRCLAGQASGTTGSPPPWSRLARLLARTRRPTFLQLLAGA